MQREFCGRSSMLLHALSFANPAAWHEARFNPELLLGYQIEQLKRQAQPATCGFDHDVGFE